MEKIMRTFETLERIYAILSTLNKYNLPIPLSLIASETGIPKTTAHYILTSLAKKGVVSKNNARNYEITEKGRKLLASLENLF